MRYTQVPATLTIQPRAGLVFELVRLDAKFNAALDAYELGLALARRSVPRQIVTVRKVVLMQYLFWLLAP